MHAPISGLTSTLLVLAGNGHGTHCAGTAAGSAYGVAKTAIIHGVRVLNCEGSGFSTQTISGMDWVVANKIEVRSPALHTILNSLLAVRVMGFGLVATSRKAHPLRADRRDDRPKNLTDFEGPVMRPRIVAALGPASGSCKVYAGSRRHTPSCMSGCAAVLVPCRARQHPDAAAAVPSSAWVLSLACDTQPAIASMSLGGGANSASNNAVARMYDANIAVSVAGGYDTPPRRRPPQNAPQKARLAPLRPESPPPRSEGESGGG